MITSVKPDQLTVMTICFCELQWASLTLLGEVVYKEVKAAMFGKLSFISFLVISFVRLNGTII